MNDVPSTELVAIDPANALVVFTTPNAIDPLLERIRAEIDGFTPDISTATGRKAVASMAYKVARAKTYLDDAGKRLADQQKEIPKKIDATRKRIRDTLDSWRDEVRKPLTEWETAENDRIKKHQDAIAAIRALAEGAERTADQLRSALSQAEIVIDQSCEEFASEYALAKDHALTVLRSQLDRRLAHDAEQAELAKLRAEAEERKRKEREEQIARDAADRARREAEAKAEAEKKAAEDAARREREAAERRELELKLQAEAAERRAAEAEAKAKRDAEAAIAREKAETAAREADKAHRTTVNRAAMQALVEAGIGEESARTVIELIAKRKVPHVSISY